MSTQAMMITILKNNRNMLSKRVKFKRATGSYGGVQKTEYNLPQATTKQLRDIRKRMQAERQLWWVKTVTLTAILFAVLACAVLYVINLMV